MVRTTLNKLTCFQTNENVQQLNRLILSISSRKRGFDSFTPLKKIKGHAILKQDREVSVVGRPMSRQASLRLVHFRDTMVECKFWHYSQR